jgi:hypothetical protein
MCSEVVTICFWKENNNGQNIALFNIKSYGKPSYHCPVESLVC